MWVHMKHLLNTAVGETGAVVKFFLLQERSY